MADLRFEWDEHKSTQNRRKHGVSFKEAETVFFDERALLIADPDDSDGEDRFIMLGLSAAAGTLVVCHCVRTNGDVIRIISARKANRAETQEYKRRLEK